MSKIFALNTADRDLQLIPVEWVLDSVVQYGMES